MSRIHASLTQLKRDKKGIATIEYALIAALIAFVLIGAIASYGSSLAVGFDGVSGAFSNAQAAPASSGGSFCRQTSPSLSAPDTSCRRGVAGAAATGDALALAE